MLRARRCSPSPQASNDSKIDGTAKTEPAVRLAKPAKRSIVVGATVNNRESKAACKRTAVKAAEIRNDH